VCTVNKAWRSLIVTTVMGIDLRIQLPESAEQILRLHLAGLQVPSSTEPFTPPSRVTLMKSGTAIKCL
jgi:hypothetical protein